MRKFVTEWLPQVLNGEVSCQKRDAVYGGKALALPLCRMNAGRGMLIIGV
jgi:hypothetical protein